MAYVITSSLPPPPPPRLFLCPQDVFEVISPAAVRKLKAERPANVEALLRMAVAHLEKVSRVCRVLVSHTRRMPLLVLVLVLLFAGTCIEFGGHDEAHTQCCSMMRRASM